MVVLPGAVPERARVGTGPDHSVVGAVQLPGGAGCVRGRCGRAPGGVLQGEGLPVGVVPAAARAWQVTNTEFPAMGISVVWVPTCRCSQADASKGAQGLNVVTSVITIAIACSAFAFSLFTWRERKSQDQRDLLF